jgi:hypothetical protein
MNTLYSKILILLRLDPFALDIFDYFLHIIASLRLLSSYASYRCRYLVIVYWTGFRAMGIMK